MNYQWIQCNASYNRAFIVDKILSDIMTSKLINSDFMNDELLSLSHTWFLTMLNRQVHLRPHRFFEWWVPLSLSCTSFLIFRWTYKYIKMKYMYVIIAYQCNLLECNFIYNFFTTKNILNSPEWITKLSKYLPVMAPDSYLWIITIVISDAKWDLLTMVSIS